LIEYKIVIHYYAIIFNFQFFFNKKITYFFKMQLVEKSIFCNVVFMYVVTKKRFHFLFGGAIKNKVIYIYIDVELNILNVEVAP